MTNGASGSRSFFVLPMVSFPYPRAANRDRYGLVMNPIPRGV
jgi:hypothetical protein